MMPLSIHWVCSHCSQANNGVSFWRVRNSTRGCEDFTDIGDKLGFFAWTWDAFDFHWVTLSYPDLTETFGRSDEQMTQACRFVLVCRALGGCIFRFLADK